MGLSVMAALRLSEITDWWTWSLLNRWFFHVPLPYFTRQTPFHLEPSMSQFSMVMDLTWLQTQYYC